MEAAAGARRWSRWDICSSCWRCDAPRSARWGADSGRSDRRYRCGQKSRSEKKKEREAKEKISGDDDQERERERDLFHEI